MGVCFALRTVGSIHRTAHHTLTKGDDTNRMMTNLFDSSNS